MNKPSVSAGVVAGVALGAAALGAAAVAVRAACLQVARTRNGLARVKRVHALLTYGVEACLAQGKEALW